MNVSINSIAFDVLEMHRASLKDTDSLDIRQVYHWINTARAFFIKQRLDRNIFHIYEEEIQTIPDQNLVATTGSTGVVNTGNVMPSTLNRKGYPGTITKVSYPYTTTDLAFNVYPVQLVTAQRFPRVGNRKFNSGLYYATIGKDRKLYFKTYTLTGFDLISFDGVFQDPIEVMILNGVTAPYDADYPLNSDLIKDLTKLIVSERFQLVLQQIEDKEEDGRDTTVK